MCVPSKPIQPSLMFVGKARRLLWSGAPERCFNQVSISPIFYEQLFCMKVFCAALMCLQFWFVIFWQKDLGAKAAHKLLVILTPGRLRSYLQTLD
jgi:hypothetical protein